MPRTTKGPPLSHVLQLRLNDRQRRALELIGEATGHGLAESARLAIEAQIASTDWLRERLVGEGLIAPADDIGALLDVGAAGGLTVSDDATS